jgi:mRNA interferase MazF
MARAGHPSRITVMQASPEGQQMGLHTDSVILTDNLATVHENEIEKAIGSCPIISAVDGALRHTLSL